MSVDAAVSDSESGAAAAQSGQLVIRMTTPWRLVPGCLYGIRQATLTGGFLIRIAPDYSFDALDAVFARLLDETPYQPTLGPCTTSGLAGRALHLMAALQTHYSIPVQDTWKVGAPVAIDDGSMSVPVAAPWYTREATQACIQWVTTALNAVIMGSPDSEDVRKALDLGALGNALKPYSVTGLNMFHFLRAAVALDIPFRKVASPIFSLGMGINTRLMDSTISDRTPHLGVKIAHSKVMTAEVLRHAGLPAPVHMTAVNEDAAVTAANALGYPVVVKPVDQEQGRGVAANLRDADAVKEAFAHAVTFSRKVLVEKHFHGKDYRLTVIGGEVVKIENRIAGGVTGDGISTIAALVSRAQDTPRFRKILRDSGKVPLSLDAEALGLLGEAGLTPESIPDDGHYLILRRKNNVSTGGLQIRVDLADAHPDNLALAIRAAGLLSLDFAGIDLLIADIAASWLETGALICEVNAQPQIGVRTTPTIYRDVLSALMAKGGYIPVHLIITTAGTTTEDGEAMRAANERGCNGVSTGAGIWIDGKRLVGTPSRDYHAAAILLSEPTVRSALCILTAEDVISMGLPAGRFTSIRFLGSDETAPAHLRDVKALTPRVQPHTERLLS